MTSPHIKTKSPIFKITTAALLPIAALAAQPSIAAENIETIKVTVGYQDLNLSSTQGQKRLSYRINAAVKKACNIYGTRNIVERQQMNICKEKAIKSAYRQITNVMDSKNVKLANKSIFVVGN